MIVGSHPRFDPKRLQQGGYVLYFRHASAEDGRDKKDSTEAGWWRSEDPQLTRQLDHDGWEQGVLLGDSMRKMHLKVDEVVTSEFRRANDTGLLLNVGEVETSSDLTPLVYDDTTLPERIEKRINQEPDPGTNTVLVAHGHVTPLFGFLEEGDAAVFDPGQEKPEFKGFIDYDDWKLS
jgi:phosphohistidine phosphatase SixA